MKLSLTTQFVSRYYLNLDCLVSTDRNVPLLGLDLKNLRAAFAEQVSWLIQLKGRKESPSFAIFVF